MGQRGAAPLEAVLTFPLFIFFILAIIQGSMWYVAQEAAQAAAEQGARAGAEYQSTSADGVNQAWNFIDQTNTATLLSAQVTASGSDASEVTITVTGTGPSVLPFWPGPPILASVQMPVEQLTSGDSW